MKRNMYNIFANIIRILIIGIFIFKVTVKDYSHLEMIPLTLIMTFYDKILENILKIKLGNVLKFFLLFFIFFAQILGTALYFYQIFEWWDIFLHTLSGVLAYFVGIDILKSYCKKTPPKIVCFLFAICFSMSTGVIWEIFEFLADHFLGKHAQMARGKKGLAAVEDTMIDLICLTIGTLFSCSYHALKKKK